jgi:hypothetical protein
MRSIGRPFIAGIAAIALLPLAGCYDDGYGPDRGYGPPPPPPPPPPGYYRDAPPPPPPPPGGYGYDNGYHPERDYRDEPGRERALSRQDQVYRGQDGRYYCKRSDGTTGLVVGAIGGAALGAILGGGGALGTLLGAGGGALLGKSVDQGQVHCR